MSTATALRRDQKASPKRRRVRLTSVDDRATWSAPLIMFALLMILGSLLALALIESQIVERQVEAERLGEQIGEASETNLRLSLDVARLEAPRRVLEEAQNRLGMVTPDDRPYLAPIVPGDPVTPLAPPGDDPFGPNQ